MDMRVRDPLRFALLNDWQRGFPLVAQPFAGIGATCGAGETEVIAQYRALLRDGAISRIGGVWSAGAGGAALLCAFAVPAQQLDAVAALVSAVPGVNHNYEREHRYNLWFVITGRDAATVARSVDALEAQAGCAALRLRMQRAYRIDLGFDLRDELAACGPAAAQDCRPVARADAPLAALLEGGLPLMPQPYDVWADTLRQSRAQLLATLQRWLCEGTLRRFGAIVRHQEAGFTHNAMTLFDVPDESVDLCGLRLAGQRGVTLAYRRERATGWPYNLYCMVHGRDRTAVRAAIDEAIANCELQAHAGAVLFSRRRFKQGGASYFRAACKEAAT
ncbi:MAG: Lrp/AsnC family transcriptional regulator [Burkholderiaceae bacterium]